MFRSGLLVMVITMVSRVLGLVRATIVRKDLKTKNNYEHNKKHLSKLPQTQE